jgi:SET domain
MSGFIWMPGLRLYRNLEKPSCSPLPSSSTTDASVQVDYEAHTQVRAVDGKGFGLFATAPIPQFEMIFADPALLGLYHDENLVELDAKYLTLSSEERATFDELAELTNPSRDERLRQRLLSGGYDSETAQRMIFVSRRFLANAFNVESEDAPPDDKRSKSLSTAVTLSWVRLMRGNTSQDMSEGLLKRAIFPLTARINHSCAPNAHAHYQPATRSQAIYSLRPIEAGEEITIAYFDLTLPPEERSQRAQDWGFKCQCSTCVDRSSPEAKQHEVTLDFVRSASSQVRDALMSMIMVKKGNLITNVVDEQLSKNADVSLQRMKDAVQRLQRHPALRPVLPLL